MAMRCGLSLAYKCFAFARPTNRFTDRRLTLPLSGLDTRPGQTIHHGADLVDVLFRLEERTDEYARDSRKRRSSHLAEQVM